MSDIKEWLLVNTLKYGPPLDCGEALQMSDTGNTIMTSKEDIIYIRRNEYIDDIGVYKFVNIEEYMECCDILYLILFFIDGEVEYRCFVTMNRFHIIKEKFYRTVFDCPL